MVNKIIRFFSRCGYYWIGIHLPVSYNRFGRIAQKFRAACARKFLIYVGNNANIEHGAMITSLMSIGDNSGVGIDAKIRFAARCFFTWHRINKRHQKSIL